MTVLCTTTVIKHKLLTCDLGLGARASRRVRASDQVSTILGSQKLLIAGEYLATKMLHQQTKVNSIVVIVAIEFIEKL